MVIITVYEPSADPGMGLWAFGHRLTMNAGDVHHLADREQSSDASSGTGEDA